MLNEDVGQLLQDYFSWAKTNDPCDIGYPHIDPVRRLLGSSLRSAGLSDDEAAYVDMAMAYLKREEPESYRVVVRVFKDGKSLRWMEVNREGDRRTTANLISRGTQFIRGAIFGAEMRVQKSGGAIL